MDFVEKLNFKIIRTIFLDQYRWLQKIFNPKNFLNIYYFRLNPYFPLI